MTLSIREVIVIASLLAIIALVGFLYHRTVVLEERNAALAQRQIEFQQYSNGSAQSNANIATQKELLIEMSKIWSDQIRQEIKENKEEIRSLSKAVAELKEVEAEGPSIDTGASWTYRDDYLEASTRKTDGWFSYRIYPRELRVDVLETQSEVENVEGVKKLRIQVTDLKDNSLLTVKDYQTTYNQSNIKQELKVPLFSSKTTKVFLAVGVLAVAGVLLSK